MTALWSNKGSHHVRAHGLRPRWQCPYAGDRGTMGRDERNGPREIMDNALAEMAEEAGGTLGPPRANLAAFRGKTGPPGPRRGRPRRGGPRRRRTEGVARGPGPPCPPGLPTRQAGCCGEARRTRRHAQAASGRGPRGRPGHRQGPRRRPPAPRAGQAQVRSRAAGQPRSQVSYQARRGLSGGLGV